eukprot:12490871-Alexandrium_andersonii.AAC.1
MVRSLPKQGRADFRMVSSPLGISRHRSQQDCEDRVFCARLSRGSGPVSYTHLRAHETSAHL